MGEVLLLNRKQVESVLNMSSTIKVMEKAFSQLSDGSAILPQRIVISSKKGVSLYMPAFLPQSESMAVKVVTVFKKNPELYDIPTTLGKVLLQDVNTGDVRCIMDGGYLTAMRTGAVSGCAIKYLARESVETVGLFGTGVQGMTQLWAACEARPSIKSGMVYDLREDTAKDFAKQMSEKLNVPINVVDSAEELVKNSDVILTATTSAAPIFHGKWVNPGTHISGIGSHSPGTRELDGMLIQRSKVVCDQISACLTEAGDIIIPINEGLITEDHLHADLGDVVTGKKPGRESDEEITLFKSVGLAIQDAATAKLVFDEAIKSNIGTSVEI
ncbi:MAG: ornithine cyclodeaminase family protein [Candidatus Hodarchaeales archaeon]|jgi:ornithine cyclodeaminase/alanine dehydrogenase